MNDSIISQRVIDRVIQTYCSVESASDALSHGLTHYDENSIQLGKRVYEYLITQNTQPVLEINRKLYALPCTRSCCYCGQMGNLGLERIESPENGGLNICENIILACRECMESKKNLDLLDWCTQTHRFPSLYVLHRYLKLAYNFILNNDLWDMTIEESWNKELPFTLELFPKTLPPLEELSMFIPPRKSLGKNNLFGHLTNRTFVFTDDLCMYPIEDASRAVRYFGGSVQNKLGLNVTDLILAQTDWDDFINGVRVHPLLAQTLDMKLREHPIQIIPENELTGRLLRILLDET